MLISETPLTKDDFERCNWQNVILSSPRKRCSDYFLLFVSKAKEAEALGDIKAHAVMTLMADITYPRLIMRRESKDIQFEDADIFNKVSDEHLAVLTEVVVEVTDSEMRARIADLLWIRNRLYVMVELAIDAYLKVAHSAEDPVHWVEWVLRIERAFRLAASVDQKKKGAFATVIDYIEDLLERYQEDSGFLLAELMELLQEHRLGSSKKHLLLIQKVVARVEAQHNWHKARTYLLIQARWHAINHDAVG